MKIAWATDIHLDHLAPPLLPGQTRRSARELFIEELAGLPSKGYDRLIITGDISNADAILRELYWLRNHTPGLEIAFVLGNHDFYGAHRNAVFNEVRDEVNGVIASTTRLTYLHSVDGVELAEGLWLTGVDGWFDGRGGEVRVSSWAVLQGRERQHALRSVSSSENVARLAPIADADTDLLEGKLRRLIKRGAKHLLIATHVPPFHEASRHKGRPGPAATLWLYANIGLGLMLAEMARRHPSVSFVVLAGHTHDATEFVALPNLRVLVQAAEYEKPGYELLELDKDTRLPTRKVCRLWTR